MSLSVKAICISLLLLMILHPAPAATQSSLPHPTGWVNDFAGMIDAKTQRQISELCHELDAKTNAQIAVATIDSLQGKPIADYAHLLFNDWGIGHKEDNRGMLILLAKDDRKYYIAVGRGFEKLFPNGRVAAIGNKMIPDLKEQHSSDAVLKAAGGNRWDHRRRAARGYEIARASATCRRLARSQRWLVSFGQTFLSLKTTLLVVGSGVVRS